MAECLQSNFLRYSVSAALILALLVVMLGAYTRLTNAGLGCPDWPGCYGHMVLPKNHSELQSAQEAFPQNPIETSKAWTEMVHRYAAGTLAMLVVFIILYTMWQRSKGYPFPWRLPFFLLILILFQAILGMWTVTLKLLPVVVMGHLLGGILIFSCLMRFRLQLSQITVTFLPKWRFWIALGVAIVFFQIALGGWVSANYAGIACIGFPQCNGQWLPPLYFSQGFHLLSPLGGNYQGGVLDNPIRMTIQFVHRMGAFVTAIYILIVGSCLLLKIQEKSLRTLALLAILLVIAQFTLGVFNVIYLLPLWVAVAHNGVAALLLATMFMMQYLSQGRSTDVRCN
jgi:cytochrome c oxidase assembly protein subunit 15